MYLFKDLIEIDKRYEKSINLQLDAQDIEKMNAYIPTKSSVAILKEYLLNIKEKREHATVLIGPYGKGKSHLLLVLLGLLSKKERELKSVLKQIEKVDIEATNIAKELIHAKRRYLPVIITTTGDDLNQAFLQGLNQALETYELGELVLDSYYSKAIETILNWEKNYKETFEQFRNIIQNDGINYEAFIKELRELKEERLTYFQKIYPTLTAGSVFSPMVQTEIIKIYEEVNKELIKNKGYEGIYIVFDEFSKYIESYQLETFSRNMKVLQDICELANNGKTGNIFITFITHKSVKEYGSALPKEIKNSFIGVEGRLSKKLFVVSARNNYELLQNTLNKTAEFEKNKEQISQLIVIQDSYQTKIFSGLFDYTDYMNMIGIGCYPLTPISAYILIQISEKVAQNERTIFTFIASDEYGSFYRLLKEGKRGTFVGADAIYDYFKGLFKEQVDKIGIHNEWLKAEYAIASAESETQIQIIKALALISMLKNAEEVPACDETILLALGIDPDIYQENMQQLKERQIIVYRSKLGVYAFKNNVGIDLEKEIQNRQQRIDVSKNLVENLKEASDFDYILPKLYNQRYAMTRFFRYVFMLENAFLALKNTDVLFNQVFSDGVVINVVRESKDKSTAIHEKTKELNDPRIVVIYPKDEFYGNEELKRLLAINELLNDVEFIEHNKVLEQELLLCKEDVTFELNAKLDMAYLVSNKNCNTYHVSRQEVELDTQSKFNSFISNICESYYKNTPIINNELLNVRNIGSQYKKARNKIVDEILLEEDLSKYLEGTSPEAIVFRAALVNTNILRFEAGHGTSESRNDEIDNGCRQVLEEIRNFVKQASNKKVSFEVLFTVLHGENFGVRNGVLPLFIALELIRLDGTPVIYLENKEVLLNSEIINNICKTPKDYILFVEQKSKEKEAYLDELENLFCKKQFRTHLSKYSRMNEIVQDMQKWYRNLPGCATSCINEDKYSEIIQKLSRVWKRLDVNPRELLFVDILNITQVSELKHAGKILAEIKEFLDMQYRNVIQTLSATTKECFGKKSENNLKAVLQEWYDNISGNAAKMIFSESCTKLIQYIAELDNNDETEIIPKIAKIIMDVYLEDFTIRHLTQYEANLRSILDEVNQSSQHESENTKKLLFTSSSGEEVEKYFEANKDSSSDFFKNSLQDVLEEYGDTLDVNQKVAVLLETIEELFKIK